MRKGHRVRHQSLAWSDSVRIGQVPIIHRMSKLQLFFSKVKNIFQSLCIIELKFHGQGRLNSDISTNLQMERFQFHYHHHQILQIVQFNFQLFASEVRVPEIMVSIRKSFFPLGHPMLS